MDIAVDGESATTPVDNSRNPELAPIIAGVVCGIIMLIVIGTIVIAFFRVSIHVF